MCLRVKKVDGRGILTFLDKIDGIAPMYVTLKSLNCFFIQLKMSLQCLSLFSENVRASPQNFFSISFFKAHLFDDWR